MVIGSSRTLSAEGSRSMIDLLPPPWVKVSLLLAA